MTGRKKLEKLKKIKKTEDGKIIRNATRETLAKVRAICTAYSKEKRRVGEIAAELGWSEQSFYRATRLYADCKELANSVGLGLRRDAEVVPAKVQAPKMPEKTLTLSDLVESCGRTSWTEEQKCGAINAMLERMKKGVPLGYAAHLSGIRLRILKEWCREVPGLVELLEHADAALIETMMGWLAEAGAVASRQGKLGEVLKGLEQRLPERWGTIERLDIVARDEAGAKQTLKIPAKQFTTECDFEIKETS